MSSRDEFVLGHDGTDDGWRMVLDPDLLTDQEVREVRRVFKVRHLVELDLGGQLRVFLFVTRRRAGVGHRRAFREVRGLEVDEARAQIDLMSATFEPLFGLGRADGTR